MMRPMSPETLLAMKSSAAIALAESLDARARCEALAIRMQLLLGTTADQLQWSREDLPPR